MYGVLIMGEWHSEKRCSENSGGTEKEKQLILTSAPLRGQIHKQRLFRMSGRTFMSGWDKLNGRAGVISDGWNLKLN